MACEPPQPKATALFLHGWSDHAGRWRYVGEALQRAGVAAYALDQRGHGRSGGRRGYLSRFSQLLGDLQAFRRAVRRRVDRPQALLGHSFGGLVTLRYLETQPSDPIAAAVISSPWLALAFRPPAWKRVAGRVLQDLWATFPVPLDRKSTRLNSSHLVISYAVFCLKKKNTCVSAHVVPSAEAFPGFTSGPLPLRYIRH